ncbi:acyl-CoA synthetase [Actinomadura macrotermitis]|uniref:Long-chain-fatty-acid--CoA/3-oxocholest-4-en-26-oate--CoA ligase n=1 Tax=Actinomadura macrotermitis TaxID=2585200 RepID=A0A7K0BWT5_9ACTN|nr:acyl-CoA synthetase [Actinomadura macrotermitis]MQY05640.1 Long-chain-fatty-acid--CoA/3-oxocholest-4-en-26-oate--CoA ligase [Actinomadura macrotermitis]
MARSYNLADLLEILAEAGPDRPALVAGDQRRTYRELNERASRVGHHLSEAGVRAGQHVAILAYNRVEWIEAMLGIFKIRAVPIPVNFRYVAGELHHVLSDSDSVALIGERSLLAKVEEVRADLPKLRHIMVIEDGADNEVPGSIPYEAALAGTEWEDEFPERSSDDRYIMYTGGTTGYPKGVEWRCEDIFFGALGGGNVLGDPISSPEAIAANAEQPPMAVLDCAPVMHGAGQWVACMGLFSGAKVVLYTDHAFDPAEALRLLAEEQANVMMVVGDVMARPIAKELDRGGHDVSSLFAIASGGAPLTEGAKDELKAHLPNVLFLDNYGASETGACGPSVGGKEGTARFQMKPGITVLDDDLKPVRPGEIGKLARSGHIPLGYYNDPKKTASTFFTDADGVRWSVPGDYASLEEDGTIVLLGRGSLMINTGGEKVYPEEVEVALKDHPDVYDVVVVGLPDERFGQRVAAVVAPRPGTAPTLEELTEHCRGRLAGYKLPRTVKLVEEVQRTAVGKSDYKWAKAVFADASS